MTKHKFGIGLVFLLVPLMLLILPLPPNKGKWGVHKQDFILGTALAIAALSAVAYVVPNPFYPKRSIWPLILGGTALLLSANIIWNKQLRDYAGDHPEYRREVFRRAMVLTLHWPIYGRYDNAIARFDPETSSYSFATLGWALTSGLVIATWYLWARNRSNAQPWAPADFAILICCMLATICTFAKCEQKPDRFDNGISGYGEFAKDMHRFKGVRGTLRHYVERMPTLEWYGQHYPPGNLILMQIEQQLGLPGMTKSIVVLLTALSVVPLYLLAKELNLSNEAAGAGVLLYAASTTVLVLCTINTTSMLVFPATMCLWMLVRGLKTGAPTAAALLGVFYFGYLLFSFSASIVGVLMALITILAWWQGLTSIRKVVVTGGVALATLAVATVAVYAATHFNIIACFAAAVRGHQEQQGNGGFDDARRYLLRSTGNVIAYLTSIVPICLLAFAAITSKRATPWQRSLFIAAVATVFIAGFSGLFYLETERIWIFLTPALALAAGYEAARRTETDGPRIVTALLLLVFLISCTQEFFFQHYR